MTTRPTDPRIDALTSRILRADPERALATRRRQANLTKPPGSLGQVEAVAERLGGWVPDGWNPESAGVAIFAADHGVAAAGVSAYPPAVTRQMVANFARGGAAATVLARQHGLRFRVVDAGVLPGDPHPPGVMEAPVGPGTRSLLEGPAMTREEAVTSLLLGARVADELIDEGARLLIGGEMGIGNTTSAAAIAAALLPADPADVTGRGTGIDEAAWHHKVRVIEQAFARETPDPTDPVGVLALVGGFEIGALAGFLLAGAAARVPVLVDGFIVGSAALLAQALAPGSVDGMIASHRSLEPGHALVLKRLGLRPLLDLDLRLGEASGALLAYPLVVSAWRLLQEMATFDEAAVSGPVP